jgi:hypothetical protein
MAKEIDARTQHDAPTFGADFLADGGADALLQVRVPARAACHRDRKSRGVPSAHTARTVHHAQARNLQSRISGGIVQAVDRVFLQAVHLRDLFRQRHQRQQLIDLGLDGLTAVAAETERDTRDAAAAQRVVDRTNQLVHGHQSGSIAIDRGTDFGERTARCCVEREVDAHYELVHPDAAVVVAIAAANLRDGRLRRDHGRKERQQGDAAAIHVGWQ